MNNKKYLFAIDMINIILRFLVAFSIMGAILIAITNNTIYLQSIWYLILAPFVSYLIGKKIQQLWIFILLHLLLLPCYLLFFHNIILNTIYGTYLILLFATAISQKTKGNVTPKNINIVFLLFIASSYFYSEYMKLVGMKHFFFFIAVLFILLFFMNQYLISFRTFILFHEEKGELPIHQIERNNHVLVLIFGMISSIAIMIHTLLPINRILAFFGQLLLNLLKAVFSFFHFKIKPGKPSTPFNLENTRPPFTQATDNPIIKILSTLLTYVIILLLIVVLIGLIIHILRKIYTQFYAHKTYAGTDMIEFIPPFDQKKRANRKERRRQYKLHRSLFLSTNNEKIRKYYYDAIIHKSHGNQITKQMTPTQITHHAFSTSNPGKDQEHDTYLKDVTALYEKARYSQEACTKSELLKLKYSIKNLS